MQNKNYKNDYTLTESDENLLLSMYYDNIKFDKMIELTKLPNRKVRKFFKDKGLGLVKRYTLNESYFDTIDTSKKAYWLGYLWTDGFVGSGKYSNIVLSSIDENVIDEFNKDLSFNGINYKKIDKTRKTSFGDNPLYETRFSSKTMAESLRSHNIVSGRKEDTFIDLENIPPKELEYLLFGMIDGDGSVESRNNNVITVQLYATSNNTKEYLKLVELLNLSYSIKYNKEKNCNYIRFLLKDEHTRNTIKKYLKNSLIERKSAPSLS